MFLVIDENFSLQKFLDSWKSRIVSCPCCEGQLNSKQQVIFNIYKMFFDSLPFSPNGAYPCFFSFGRILTQNQAISLVLARALKVHKNENFFGFDFEFCTISMLVMH